MKPTILIVEDTDLCRETLEIAFAGLTEVEVRAVPTAEEALAEAEEQNICALVTDLHLPGMSGFDLIATLRCQPRFSALPIAVTSGDSDSTTQQRLGQLGTSAYFAKPYSPAEVRDKLQSLFSRARACRAANNGE